MTSAAVGREGQRRPMLTQEEVDEEARRYLDLLTAMLAPFGFHYPDFVGQDLDLLTDAGWTQVGALRTVSWAGTYLYEVLHERCDGTIRVDYLERVQHLAALTSAAFEGVEHGERDKCPGIHAAQVARALWALASEIGRKSTEPA